VYVDDFIGMVQGGWRHRRHVKRVLLHTLNRVFRPLNTGDSEHRQEPASVKKLRKGDATWSTQKVILGWILDSIQLTLELPCHRIARLFELLDSVVPSQRRVSTKKWKKLLGELRSMVLTVPGARGLFSVLQLEMKVRLEEGTRLRLTDQVHAVLRDFRALATELQSRPTCISELVPSMTPATMGAQDATGKGMGGVHFVPMPDGSIAPLLWRAQFPRSVQNRLVMYANPAGTITNSDLELSVSIAHHDVLAREVDVREATILNFSDNTPTVYWQRKGSVSSAGPTARLLRIQALHQRRHRYVPTFDYLPGPENVMSEDCSRRWDLTDAQLLHHFNSSYPQTQPWRLCQLSKRMHSGLISSLLTKESGRALPESGPMSWTNIGDDGNNFVWKTMWILTSKLGMIRSQLSKSLENDIATEDSRPSKTPSSIARWKTPSARWARRTPDWGALTNAKTTTENSTSAFKGN
jgi:hypothetical protein